MMEFIFGLVLFLVGVLVLASVIAGMSAYQIYLAAERVRELARVQAEAAAAGVDVPFSPGAPVVGSPVLREDGAVPLFESTTSHAQAVALARDLAAIGPGPSNGPKSRNSGCRLCASIRQKTAFFFRNVRGVHTHSKAK